MKSLDLRQPEAEDAADANRTRRGGGHGEGRRLWRYGPRSLATDELLALVLGPQGAVSGADLARFLLSRFGGLDRLARVTADTLTGVAGLGRARALRLVASLELARRLGEDTGPQRRAVRGPKDVADLLVAELRGLDREHFLGLYLDARHRVVAVRTISVGTLDASLVHPREVYLPAVGLQAAAVIVAHNHPSGCARPSGEDIELTRRLASCGDLLGIALLDHLVVGDAEIVSIREQGWPAAD